jgi:hypothetical protein
MAYPRRKAIEQERFARVCLKYGSVALHTATRGLKPLVLAISRMTEVVRWHAAGCKNMLYGVSPVNVKF